MYGSGHKFKKITEEKVQKLRGKNVSVNIRTYNLEVEDNTKSYASSDYHYTCTYSLPYLYIKLDDKDYCLFTYSCKNDCQLYINRERRGITDLNRYCCRNFEIKGELGHIYLNSEFKVFNFGNGIFPDIFRTVYTINFTIGGKFYKYRTYSKFYYEKNKSVQILNNLSYRPEINSGLKNNDTGYSEGADFEITF
uniref:Uncharacterized protein n=1 Tax=Marseillevirus LCMAC101 TaxID=2506602 RepID=A0A481YSM0_9VIRU|nr:MAG: hypothetical protein LCMAC101_00610 [Marseillevirus LCMAC101]